MADTLFQPIPSTGPRPRLGTSDLLYTPAPSWRCGRSLFELDAALSDVTLTTWPDGYERVIAYAGYHGRPVHWLGS